MVANRLSMCNCGGGQAIPVANVIVPSNTQNVVQNTTPTADEIRRLHQLRAAQHNTIRVTPNISSRR